MDAEVSTHTFLTMVIEESVCFMSCEPIFFCNYSYVVHTEYIYIFFFINWTLRMSDNLPERVQILCHSHIICITVLENIIICCQIFCDLLLKSAFERIFNVMQLILVKIKWHIKWKYSAIFAFHITLNTCQRILISTLIACMSHISMWPFNRVLHKFYSKWSVSTLLFGDTLLKLLIFYFLAKWGQNMTKCSLYTQ